MSGLTEVEPARLSWRELPESVRTALFRKLEGMYGGVDDESTFNSLTVDKQRALLIVYRRFSVLHLWNTVRRLENVYGEGGVGMNFAAWPFLKSTLERRSDFTKWFARHRKTSGGFVERRNARASLHILYTDSGERHWEAHFDLYYPWASPLNAWRHLLYEKLRHETPDWRAISEALGYRNEHSSLSVII